MPEYPAILVISWPYENNKVMLRFQEETTFKFGDTIVLEVLNDGMIKATIERNDNGEK